MHDPIIDRVTVQFRLGLGLGFVIIIIIIIHEVLLPALHTCPGMHYKNTSVKS